VSTYPNDVVRDLVNEFMNYLEGYYPWGIITKPLTPTITFMLTLLYSLTVVFLAVGILQTAVIIRYGILALKYRATKHPFITKRPPVTIMVPIKNEPVDLIKECLINASRLDYPKDKLEVLFVSDDEPSYVEYISREVARLSRKLGINAMVVGRREHVGYRGGALNYGLKYSQGEIIMIVDVDTRYSEDYLNEAVAMLLSGYDAVTATWGGYCRLRNHVGMLGSFMYNVYNEFFIRGRHLGGGLTILSGSNTVIWRRVLEEVGGYCHCISEDLDLTLRLRSRGYRLGLMSGKVLSEVPSSYRVMKNQLARWQFSGIWCLRKHLGEILRSNMSAWEKLDSILWAIQFPSLSITAISIIMSIILMFLGVLLPPIQIWLLNVVFVALILVQFVVIIMLSRRMGYSYLEGVANTAKSAVLALMLSFPMLIYAVEALTRDDWLWVPTPKGSRHNLRLGTLMHEVVTMMVLVAILIVAMTLREILVAVYTTCVIFIMAYGLSMVRDR